MCVPVPVPVEVASVTRAFMFVPGPTSAAMPVVMTKPALNDTEYAVPAEHVTATVDVAVSVPKTVAILPKFIAEALIAQVCTTFTLDVRVDDCVAAKAEWLDKS